MFSLSVDDTEWCLDYPCISDDIEEIKKITEKTLLNEWTGEVSPRTSHSEVVLHPGMSGHQKFCGKWCKILHSSNFLAPNYNSKKTLFYILSLLYRCKSGQSTLVTIMFIGRMFSLRQSEISFHFITTKSDFWVGIGEMIRFAKNIASLRFSTSLPLP